MISKNHWLRSSRCTRLQASPQSTRKSVCGGKQGISTVSVGVVPAPSPLVMLSAGSLAVFDILHNCAMLSLSHSKTISKDVDLMLVSARDLPKIPWLSRSCWNSGTVTIPQYQFNKTKHYSEVATLIVLNYKPRFEFFASVFDSLTAVAAVGNVVSLHYTFSIWWWRPGASLADTKSGCVP